MLITQSVCKKQYPNRNLQLETAVQQHALSLAEWVDLSYADLVSRLRWSQSKVGLSRRCCLLNSKSSISSMFWNTASQLRFLFLERMRILYFFESNNFRAVNFFFARILFSRLLHARKDRHSAFQIVILNISLCEDYILMANRHIN